MFGRFVVNDKSSFKAWRIYAGFTREDCARLFEVSRQTVDNWEAGKTKPPRAVFLCLQIYSRRLDFLGEPWEGFRFSKDGCIESAEGDFIWWYEVRAIKHLYAAAKMERGEILHNIRSKNGLDIYGIKTTEKSK